MTALASTDVTITLNSRDRHVLGGIRMANGNLAFGDGALTYPNGGVPMPAVGNFGMNREVSMFDIADSSGSGFIYRYDSTNRKIKVFTQAPPIVFEEVVALTANTTGTTKYPMAWPLYASNGNQALPMLPVGLTPVTNTIGVNMHSATPGTRATITALPGDTLTTVTISYITQAWKEVFDNLVEGETMAAGATTTNGITFTEGTPDVISFISAGAFLCGLMVGLDLNGTVSAPKPLKKGETAVAAEYALDWTDTSPAATSMEVVTTANWNAATATIYFNYIKKPTSGFLYDRFIEEDSSASSSQVYTMASSSANVIQPLLWSTPGYMPSVTVSSTSATWPIGGIGMTVGSTTQWQPTNYHMKNKSVGAGTFTSGTGALATLTVAPSYIYGVPEEIPTLQPLELPDATIIQATTLKFQAWGR